MGEVFEGMRGARQERHLKWHQRNVAALVTSGLKYRSVNDGESLLFREPGKPKVDFYPSTGRWRIVGAQSKTFRGGAAAFIGWYAKQ